MPRIIITDNICYQCGASEEWASVESPISLLSVPLTNGHWTESSVLQFRAICSVCNEGASNITPDRPSVLKLKAQIRKARGDDQMDLLAWLIAKFPAQARSMLADPDEG